ncbi:MAG: alpha/beta hydrolase [bacterium]
MKGKRIIKRLLLAISALLLAVAGGFLIWAYTPSPPMPEALAALEADSAVEVQTSGPWLVFRPIGSASETGLIFYPGAHIDPRAYAPPAKAIAARGYLVAVVPMPLNLAVFGLDRATAVMQAFPQVRHWVVGGHSLGGAMAARFVYQNPQAVQGLLLWGAYPPDDLSGSALSVASLYGALDGLSSIDQINASRSFLPPSTRWVEIAGGNHAQFGWYGPQAGDLPAEISRQAQQVQVVEGTVALLSSLTKP